MTRPHACQDNGREWNRRFISGRCTNATCKAIITADPQSAGMFVNRPIENMLRVSDRQLKRENISPITNTVMAARNECDAGGGRHAGPVMGATAFSIAARIACCLSGSVSLPPPAAVT